jgi:hypothetical protein
LKEVYSKTAHRQIFINLEKGQPQPLQLANKNNKTSQIKIKYMQAKSHGPLLLLPLNGKLLYQDIAIVNSIA